ncbi:MmyB family transcriptional regulator [Nocardia amamiensis]|uniref:MmyB family transcriptional regulator n=1 Tax=Nocardia amamiensis TaxID=404578 RepID=UPI0008329663|nr:helix-turn-helix domain-containing protein [Nocardia amamiensis]
MTQNPAHRSSGNARGGRLPRIPTLGSTCRLIREDLGLSRFGAQQRHGISPSYLFDIEKDDYTPSFETLEKIISGYGLNPMQARHLRELRTPAEELAPADNLRQCVNDNTDLISHLHDLEQREVLAAYLDPLWNALASNDSFQATTPGLQETDCIPTWLFSPAAKSVFVQWPHESAHSVATLKATLGRYRDSEQAKDLMRQLRPVKEFRRQWSASIDVAYGRDTNDLLHLRDPATDELSSYRLSVADVTQTQNVLLLTAIRKPYSGPEPS